ncbi:MAG: hypothetical protein JST28_05555 [Acidobacteria bacterium]|nr:hypothetical protein [Acidobacteriota bacterium]
MQRWHSEYGLPVHHLGGDASSVYAFSDELDVWLRRRDGSVLEDPPQRRSSPAVNLEGSRSRTVPDNSARKYFSNPEAMEMVQRARRLWEVLSASNLSMIAGLYRRATDVDPSNPAAFAGLSQALIAQAVLGNLHPKGAFQSAQAALRRALEIDPDLFETLCASALIKVFVERDWEGAELLLERSRRMARKASQTAVGGAFLAIAGQRLNQAREALRCAAQERPLNTSIAELLCWIEYLDGNFGSAIALVKDARGSGHSGAVLDTAEALSQVSLGDAENQIVRLESMTSASPRNYALLGVLGYVYGKAGRWADARRAIESMTQTGLTGVYDFAYPIALTYLGIEQRNEAQRWIEQSYRHGSLWSLGFGSDPLLAELRSDPKTGVFYGSKNYPSRETMAGERWLAS